MAPASTLGIRLPEEVEIHAGELSEEGRVTAAQVAAIHSDHGSLREPRQVSVQHLKDGASAEAIPTVVVIIADADVATCTTVDVIVAVVDDNLCVNIAIIVAIVDLAVHVTPRV